MSEDSLSLSLSLSLSPSVCDEMFAFVDVIVDFIVTAREDFLRLGRMKSVMFIMTDAV